MQDKKSGLHMLHQLHSTAQKTALGVSCVEAKVFTSSTRVDNSDSDIVYGSVTCKS